MTETNATSVARPQVAPAKPSAQEQVQRALQFYNSLLVEGQHLDLQDLFKRAKVNPQDPNAVMFFTKYFFSALRTQGIDIQKITKQQVNEIATNFSNLHRIESNSSPNSYQIKIAPTPEEAAEGSNVPKITRQDISPNQPVVSTTAVAADYEIPQGKLLEFLNSCVKMGII